MKKKKETRKQKLRREAKELEASLRGKTKEEKIAICKARVAKYHPEPDTSSISPSFRRALSKMEFEKSKKKIFMSIISVPMGGQNKR